jgi:hypothetical protein
VDKDVKTQKGNIMNKIEKLIDRMQEAFNTCVDNVRTHGGYEMWEDYDMIRLPEDLTPEEKMELIDKISKITHYCCWADLPTIMQESKNANFIMIYVDDVSSWWRFEA